MSSYEDIIRGPYVIISGANLLDPFLTFTAYALSMAYK